MVDAVARLVRHFSLLVLVVPSLCFSLVVDFTVRLLVFLLVVFAVGESPSFLVVLLYSFVLLPTDRSW
jgi:ABC-type proline/glycine betaine transport system permease subunit